MFEFSSKSDESVNYDRDFININAYSEIPCNCFQGFHSQVECNESYGTENLSSLLSLFNYASKRTKQQTKSPQSYSNATGSKMMNAVLRFSFFST